MDKMKVHRYNNTEMFDVGQYRAKFFPKASFSYTT